MATCLRCSEIFNYRVILKFAADSKGENNVKIGQHLAKLWALFYPHKAMHKRGLCCR